MMWISKKIAAANLDKEDTVCAEVTDTNSGALNVQNGFEYREIESVAPRGISYVPIQGDKTIVIPVGDSFVCIGTVMKDEGLEPGELKLSSSGGASIVLKNNGSVLINGVAF